MTDSLTGPLAPPILDGYLLDKASVTDGDLTQRKLKETVTLQPSGGSREAFEQIEPLLREIGPKVTHVGGNGDALVVKLAINLSLVVQVISFCESVAMAEKAGIAREAAVDAVLKSVIASPVLGYRGPCILEQPETPFADVTLQQKDQLLGLGFARSVGAAVPFAALANELLTATRAAGFGDKDFSAVYEVFRAMGGIE